MDVNFVPRLNDLRSVPVFGNRNCFFHSIIRAMAHDLAKCERGPDHLPTDMTLQTKEKNEVMLLRMRVAQYALNDYVNDNGSELSGGLPETGSLGENLSWSSIPDYWRLIEKDGVHVGPPVALATARLLAKGIVIFYDDGTCPPLFLPCPGISNPILVIFRASRKHFELLVETKKPTQTGEAKVSLVPISIVIPSSLPKSPAVDSNSNDMEFAKTTENLKESERVVGRGVVAYVCRGLNAMTEKERKRHWR